MMLKIYQGLFFVSFTNVIIGLVCVIAPFHFAAWVGVGPMIYTSAYLFQIWGATLIGLHVVYLPGLIDPLRNQFINWSSIGIKFWMSFVFLSCGFDFYSFAAWDFICGSVLLITWILALNSRKEMMFMNA